MIEFGRETTGRLPVAESRERLCANGVGGFASGTVAGLRTRRYHGLLVAALKPPVGRTVLVSGLKERVEYDGRPLALASNRWADGTIAPDGHRLIERFQLDGTTPVWHYACADALIGAEPPFRPDGCIAQAWSVTETLRAWCELAPDA